MKFFQKPVMEGRSADAYCAVCDAPMTGDEAALNYKLTERKATRLLCPVCLGKRLSLSPETLREMITLFRKQGCVLFTPWVTESES
jgi:hypothetical protein